MKDAFDRDIAIGDIVAIGCDTIQYLGVIRGFTPTGQTQLTICTYYRELVRDRHGNYIWDRATQKHQRTENRVIEVYDQTMKYPRRLIKMTDNMFYDFEYPQQVMKLKEIQQHILEKEAKRNVPRNN